MDRIVTIRQIRNQLNDSWFLEKYKDFLTGNYQAIDAHAIQKLLKVAVVFINYGDEFLEKMGYRIIVHYSTKFQDFQPLYDYALNKGYIPISKFIENKLIDDQVRSDSFFSAYFSAFQETFKNNGVYLSFGQNELKYFSENTSSSYVLIAPTSYGKSDLIINEAYKDPTLKTCIIVPSKALLAQTKKRIVEQELFSSSFQRVITHPDMYKGDETSFLAVLTQERLLRLLQRNTELALDLVLIDEAHNMLNDDNRAILLSQVILILNKRNVLVTLKFFTPFISEGKNLEIPYASYELMEKKVKETIKIEKYFVCDFTTDKRVYMYDQFLNDFLNMPSAQYDNQFSFLLANMASKNIVYVNRPRDIESAAMHLISDRNVSSTEIEEAYNAIQDYVHPEYNLLKCIRAGVVYHHGGMPEIVRLYVENIFSKINELEFIVTSSTLLEGVNIPAEKIFLFTTKIGRRNFSKSQFKNLIGRVCRFNEVFNIETGRLNMLEPEIFVLKGSYERNNANPRNFLKQRAKIDISINDEVNNVLLEEDLENLNTQQKLELNEAIKYLENIEPNTIASDNVDYVESEIAQLCFKNNVYDFDISASETFLERNFENFRDQSSNLISSANELLNAIHEIFVNRIEISDPNIGRLVNEPARRFYAMFIDWRSTGSSYNQMIAQFINYWDNLINPIIYVGSKWGEIKLDERNHRDFYINLNDKNDSQKINLAIVRIKEEQDFVDNSLMKYVEILNDLELINSAFYDKVKYGTTDNRIITLLKNGFSMDLAKLITNQNYIQFIQIDVENDNIIIDSALIESMENNQENVILLFELKYHVK